MEKKTLILIALLSTCAIVSIANAQDNTKSVEDQTTQTIEQKNALFNDILQSMPKEMQNRIDSASTSASKNGSTETVHTDAATKESASEKQQHALDELPAEVRAKVQQRMVEIEKNNEQRTIQLKEQIIEQRRKQSSKQ